MTDKDFFWWNFVKYKYQQQCTLLTEDPDESFSFLHRAQWKLRVTYTISWEVLDITFLVRFQQLNPLLGFMSHWCTFWVILRQATNFLPFSMILIIRLWPIVIFVSHDFSEQLCRKKSHSGRCWIYRFLFIFDQDPSTGFYVTFGYIQNNLRQSQWPLISNSSIRCIPLYYWLSLSLGCLGTTLRRIYHNTTYE